MLGCDEFTYGIGYAYKGPNLARPATKGGITNPKVCHDRCLAQPDCIAWFLRTKDDYCVAVTHYEGTNTIGWVAGRRNACVGKICCQVMSSKDIIAEDEVNYVWGLHIDPAMEDTVVNMQVGHNDFVDSNGETTWFNPDGSSLEDNPSGPEVTMILNHLFIVQKF